MASKQNTKEYPIRIIREDLRQCAARKAASLTRSVGRLTSYDVQPCMEYGQEVAAEYVIVDELLYLQQCRNALERCIASGGARLRYRWRDGHMTDTRFRKTSPGRVRVSGLLIETVLPAAG